MCGKLLICAEQLLCSSCEVLAAHAAGVRERVENLYFAYLFVLRAALKAAPLLEEIAYDTGFPLEDARTAELVRQLVSSLAAPGLWGVGPDAADAGMGRVSHVHPAAS